MQALNVHLSLFQSTSYHVTVRAPTNTTKFVIDWITDKIECVHENENLRKKRKEMMRMFLIWRMLLLIVVILSQH